MTDRLSEIRERLAKSTQGPWRVEKHEGYRLIWSDVYGEIATVPPIVSIERAKANARLIAAAPSDLTYLLSRVEAAEAARDSATADAIVGIDRFIGELDTQERERLSQAHRLPGPVASAVALMSNSYLKALADVRLCAATLRAPPLVPAQERTADEHEDAER